MWPTPKKGDAEVEVGLTWHGLPATAGSEVV